MTPLPLRELLGILLGDLIIAETHAAKASANYLREAGFVDGRKDDDWGNLRFVTFSFAAQDPDGAKVRTVRVPLLSLLPIPLQQIEQAEYEFFAKVSDVTKVVEAASEGSAQRVLDLECEVAEYSPESVPDKKGAVPKVRVKLTMRQADLPAGLSSSLRRIEQASGSQTT